MIASLAKHSVIRRNGYSSDFLAHGHEAVVDDLSNHGGERISEDTVDILDISEARLFLRRAAVRAVHSEHCEKILLELLNSRVQAKRPLATDENVELLDTRNKFEKCGYLVALRFQKRGT